MKSGSRQLLKKAHRALRAARRDLEAGDADHATVHAYYACFHIATAALHEIDRTARTHPGLHTLFFKHFVEPGTIGPDMSRILSTLYQDRQQADYAFGEVFSMEEAKDALARAEEFVTTLEAILP